VCVCVCVCVYIYIKCRITNYEHIIRSDIENFLKM